MRLERWAVKHPRSVQPTAAAASLAGPCETPLRTRERSRGAVKSFSTDSRARLAACRAARLHRTAAPVSAPLAARLRQAAHLRSVLKSEKHAPPAGPPSESGQGSRGWVGGVGRFWSSPRSATTSGYVGTCRPRKAKPLRGRLRRALRGRQNPT